ncbi:MAG: hypothetical protein KC505_00935 [Myxococcales bacterium]|nr:hypothetical protein [Myxococcales bacterium]USN50341.1 MAG: hypothetical protein H6731_08750 [Myxococcales bacterium]
MEKNTNSNGVSDARIDRRQQIVDAAKALIGAGIANDFDPVHAPLCAIDLVMVAGAPWLKEALERDYGKDESGYKKIGGGANTPKMAYFFRSAANLMHFLKRQGLYVPRGGTPDPAAGMACFLDWDDRGRFNFSPDRSGIIISTKDHHIESIALPLMLDDGSGNYRVEIISVTPQDKLDRAIIGYSDLP